jgi:hypothetical protein
MKRAAQSTGGEAAMAAISAAAIKMHEMRMPEPARMASASVATVRSQGRQDRRASREQSIQCR